MKKGLSADGVFSEIMGVIKATSLAAAYKPLSEKDYTGLSQRVAPNFTSEADRQAVYALYQAYEKRKLSLGEWDDIDRTIRLQNMLAQDNKLASLLRCQITEIFVDEIQDQRLPEIELLLDMVNSPRSCAFAGDTAQCISRDSCFRFQDLTRLFFQKYERLGTLTNQKDLSKVKLFALNKNYRTHNGILKLAAKVVDILSESFPYVIDKLTPELGEFDGPAPILFCGYSSDIFASRKADSSTVISEFGADQVLIVRDEEAKMLLSTKIADEALILTILESKGMEFQDVFLFDFFSSSPCQAGFRALANSQLTASRFDDTQYPELCVELKNLYVAITRPREMLYMVETNPAAVKPILDMWALSSDDPIIDVVPPDDPTIGMRLDEMRLGQSSRGEWEQKGSDFLDQQMYQQAMYCYKRAEKPKLVQLCQAFLEEQSGRYIVSDPARWDDARVHYLEAAKLFRECDRYDRALRCFESINEFLMAGELCECLPKTSEKFDREFSRRAADFFMLANAVDRAIPIFKRLGHHELAISAYRKINSVEELITYLQENKDEIDKKIYYKNSRIIAATVLASKNSEQELRMRAISLLNEGEREQLYTQFHLHAQLENLLISQGRFEEAITLRYSQGL
ncbi:hypothetical protein TWF696_005650 [Orbilia brochopaga]|uniref:DNA helicase n=1 Tax=Orbilia brochopaga TaxID=3140254 RepID=A0AAV9V1R9_9PEZI